MKCFNSIIYREVYRDLDNVGVHYFITSEKMGDDERYKLTYPRRFKVRRANPTNNVTK